MLVMSALSPQHLVLQATEENLLHLSWSADYFVQNRIGESSHYSTKVEEILCLETITRNLIYH